MMKRFAQEESPLESAVQIGDYVIVEKEEEGRVVDRQGGFFFSGKEGHVVLTRFDPRIEPGDLRQHGLSKEYPVPRWDLCPKLEDITHYYLIPASTFDH